MTTIEPADLPAKAARIRAHRRFLAALALFFAWVAFLTVLGMLSATGPGHRTQPVEIERPAP
jgi:hypothetical protein